LKVRARVTPVPISSAHPLGLGSASPRRKELLERLGIPLLVVPSHVDERQLPNENPISYLERVTRNKLHGVIRDERARFASVVLVADTIVLADAEILGKPASPEDARQMLVRLSGRSHEVRTRFALGRPDDPAIVHAETMSTRVYFRRLDAREIEEYVATGEGMDKAGAYAVQRIGSFAVSRAWVENLVRAHLSADDFLDIPVTDDIVTTMLTYYLGLRAVDAEIFCIEPRTLRFGPEQFKDHAAAAIIHSIKRYRNMDEQTVRSYFRRLRRDEC